uniref:Secreted protein n=1 Tax=Mesocestoides corti TaxID=53468 RepID=A0A5K3FKB9_MESCO
MCLSLVGCISFPYAVETEDWLGPAWSNMSAPLYVATRSSSESCCLNANINKFKFNVYSSLSFVNLLQTTRSQSFESLIMKIFAS